MSRILWCVFISVYVAPAGQYKHFDIRVRIY